jgi:predicted nucleotidyltransferase
MRRRVQPKARGPAIVGAAGAPRLEDLVARRDQILEIASRHGAKNVRVFGSVARGEARPDSDIDFLVDLDPDRTLFDLSELILDLQEALDWEVDVIEIGQRTAATEHISREAVAL